VRDRQFLISSRLISSIQKHVGHGQFNSTMNNLSAAYGESPVISSTIHHPVTSFDTVSSMTHRKSVVRHPAIWRCQSRFVALRTLSGIDSSSLDEKTGVGSQSSILTPLKLNH
jgi:hypothetical protein